MRDPDPNARNGQVFTRHGRLAIRNARHKDDQRPLDPDCACPACRGGYGRSYLRHLHLAREMSAARLLTLHNLAFYATLVAEARRAVEAGGYAAWASARLLELESDASAEASASPQEVAPP